MIQHVREERREQMRTLRAAGTLLLAVTLVTVVVTVGAHGQDLKTVAVGSGIGPDQGLWIVARDKGFARKYGIEIDLKPFETGTSALTAMIAGDLVAQGISSSLPSLRPITKGAQYVGVGRPMRAPKLACLAATEAIRAPKDLEGKRVGVMIGSGSEFWHFKYTEHHKIQSTVIMNLQAPEMVTALRGGQIAAFFVWQPWCRRALDMIPGTHILAVGGDDNVYPFNDFQLTFRTDFLKGQPDTALKLLRALYDATEWVRANQEEAARLWAKAFRGNVDQYVKDTQAMEWGLWLDTSDYDAYYTAAKWMKNKGLIDVKDSVALVNGFLYPDLLEQINPERVKRPQGVR
jgi:NitT/TauT family transport system substrate-binding protein